MALLALLLWAPPAQAFVLHEDPLEETSAELGLLFRTFAFIMHGPTMRPPYALTDADPLAQGIFDFRLSFAYRGPRVKVVVHNSLSGQVASQQSSSFLGLGQGVAPCRWLPLEADLNTEGTLVLRDVLDWAYVALTLGPVTLTAGRQPITFGRGKIWQTVDLVTSFSMTQVDTEYKPGADAVRLDANISGSTQLTVVAAAGTDVSSGDNAVALRGSSFALRLKHGFGESVEAGLFAGFVRYDAVVGLDAVYDAGSFDVYAELTTTILTERSLSPGLTQRDQVLFKALLGANFKPHAKITLSPELAYNGFGAWDPADYFTVALSERMAMGELYTMGQLYLGALCLWEAHPLLNVSAVLMMNPRDPSGLVSLGAVYNVASNVELKLGLYLPLGRVPDVSGIVPKPRSEFGLYPYFYFIELKAAL